MTTFTDMSDDVVLLILSHLSTRDVSSFSRSCRNLRELAIPDLYGAITWTSVESLEHPPVHLLLRSLIENPSLGAHVKHLRLKGKETLKEPLRREPLPVTLWAQGEQPKLSAGDLQAIEEFIHTAQLSPETLWKERVKSGNFNVYTLLIISLLPNLETFQSSFLYHAGNEFLASLLKQLLFSTPRPAPLSDLSSLHQVELVASEKEIGAIKAATDNEGVTSLLYLPAIQAIDASLDYQKRYKWSWPSTTPPNSATLTCLRLRYCEASEDYLARLLSTTPNLQTLLYDRWINVDDYDNCPDPRLDLATLTGAVRQVRRTLKELSLSLELYADTAMEVDHNDYDYGIQNRLGPLTDFEALETLEAPWVFLLGYAQTSRDTEKFELPPSIRHLRIGDYMGNFMDYEWTEKAMLERFEDLLSSRKERTPALEHIELRLTKSQWDWDEEGQEKLKRMCATAGVLCDVQKELDI